MKRDLVNYSKETLKGFVRIIDKQILQIWMERAPEIISHGIFVKGERIRILGKALMEHIMEHNTRPAKRLRSSFIYYGYQLVRGFGLSDEEEKKLMVAATSIEFTHTGLLIHDDFQDRDSTRRGLPTTHKFFEKYFETYCTSGDKEHFGASMAINCGDFALNFGNQVLLRSGFDADVLLPAMDILLEGVGQTIFGQSFDLILECSKAVVEEDVYELHHGKTGIYTYLTPLLVGVTLAGGSEELKQKLMEYAIPCGIAFQLQDDVIGLFGDENKTGKSAFSDIKEGKKTLLMLKTMELCGQAEKDILQEFWGNPDLTADQAKFVRSVVRDCGALEYSNKKAFEYAKKAQSVIKELRDMKDLNLNSDVLDYLEGIAEYMSINREV